MVENKKKILILGLATICVAYRSTLQLWINFKRAILVILAACIAVVCVGFIGSVER